MKRLSCYFAFSQWEIKSKVVHCEGGGVGDQKKLTKPEKSGVLCCSYQEEYRQFRWHKQGHLGHFSITSTRSMATMIKGAHPKLVQVMLTSTFFLTLSAMLFSQCPKSA